MSEEDWMSEEEFKEFCESLSDEEKIEFYQKLFASARENPHIFNLSEEQIKDWEEKLEKFKTAFEQKKQLGEVLHLVKTQLDLVEQRMNARLLDENEIRSMRF